MNNAALLSVSLIVIFGLSACSSNPDSRKTDSSQSTPTPKVHTKHTSSKKVVQKKVINQTSPHQQQWINKQKALHAKQQQQRLAYNRNWQNQQRQKADQQAKNRALQVAQAHSRNVWQQQQARKKANQQRNQQKQKARNLANQRHTQQQYAMLQKRSQRKTQPQVNSGSSINNLSQSEIRAIGDKIFRNESGSDVDKLVHWNVGENFASMGIGHFTWYPSGRRNRYGNTFPGLLDHLQSNGVRLPVWVQKARHTGAPWRTKGELNRAKRNPQVQELQNLLYQTRHIQAGYIFERAKRAMPRLVKATPPHLRSHVAQNLNAVANTKGGWYALIDYVNFKGEGLNRKGGYRGQNWGLLQVLENMRPSQPGQMALNNFADSAIATLQRRVRNSNPRRNEARWMRGWAIRCNTYRHPFVI